MLWLSFANKDVYIIYCLLFTHSALSVTYLPSPGATVHAVNRKSVKNNRVVSHPVVLSVPDLDKIPNGVGTMTVGVGEATPEGPRAGCGFLVRGQPAPPHQLFEGAL